MPNNPKPLLLNQGGVPVYPVTDASLVMNIATASGIFWATYGTTTAAEIDAAAAAGKVVACQYDGKCYVLASNKSSEAYLYFGNVYASNLIWLRVQRSNDVWVSGLNSVQLVSNKAQTISGNESNENKYPSTKAVADALSGKQNTIDASHKLPYSLLSDTPTIPAAQVQTDWNASSGMGVLLNKPNLATVATSGSYTDLSNKPTIPTVVSMAAADIATAVDTAWNAVMS